MNLSDPDGKFLHDLDMLLYNFLWNGKQGKIKGPGVFQDYEAGDLNMLDVKPVLSALKISWLKRILSDDGKLTKILQAMCPLICSIKKRDGEFANIIMQRVKKNF